MHLLGKLGQRQHDHIRCAEHGMGNDGSADQRRVVRQFLGDARGHRVEYRCHHGGAASCQRRTHFRSAIGVHLHSPSLLLWPTLNGHQLAADPSSRCLSSATAAPGLVSTGHLTTAATASAAREVEKCASMIASHSASSTARRATSALCRSASPSRNASIAPCTSNVRNTGLAQMARLVVEFLLHARDGRSRRRQHSELRAMPERFGEHRFVRFQHRDGQAPRDRLDRRPERRAREQDPSRAGAIRIVGERSDAIGDGRRQRGFARPVAAQRIIENVDQLRFRPGPREGIGDRLHRDAHRVNQRDPHDVSILLAFVIGTSASSCPSWFETFNEPSVSRPLVPATSDRSTRGSL